MTQNKRRHLTFSSWMSFRSASNTVSKICVFPVIMACSMMLLCHPSLAWRSFRYCHPIVGKERKGKERTPEGSSRKKRDGGRLNTSQTER